MTFFALAFFGNQTFLERKANAGKAGSLSERTYIMIKPDGVQRGLVGDIISRFEKKGYKYALRFY